MALQTLEFRGFPDNILDQIEREVDDVTYLLPGWISHLFVFWDGDDHENDATISTDYEYRRAILNICPAYLSVDDRNHVLIHEIGHILTDPFTSLTERIAETLVPETSRAFTMGEIARHKEMLAEDIAIFTKKISKRYDF